jgi:hypothetical protein
MDRASSKLFRATAYCVRGSLHFVSRFSFCIYVAAIEKGMATCKNCLPSLMNRGFFSSATDGPAINQTIISDEIKTHLRNIDLILLAGVKAV